MKIIQLEAQNVKRLKAIEIKPDGNVVVIGGKNGAGKSSVLDSIAYALAGKSTHPSQPVRKGEKKATVICDLGDLLVRRTMTANGGGTLTVENKEGAVYKSPQSILDALVGKLTFDPLEFSTMDARKQVETLKGLVGLDFGKLDIERQKLYDERTLINTSGKSLKVRFDEMPEYPEAPEKEISVSDLMIELERREGVNLIHQKKRETLAQNISDVKKEKEEIGNSDLEIAKLNKQIADIEKQIQYEVDEKSKMFKVVKEGEKAIGEMTTHIETLKDANETEVKDQISNAETVNKQVRANTMREAAADNLKDKRKESTDLSDSITQIDDSKIAQLAEAKFPVPGLSFSASEVLYNDIPFSQASSAEKLRVSVAMGLAMNPKLKVLLIRDGSLLDEDNLKLIAEMAEKADGQVWIEVVSTDDKCQIVIEDGMVVVDKS